MGNYPIKTFLYNHDITNHTDIKKVIIMDDVKIYLDGLRVVDYDSLKTILESLAESTDAYIDKDERMITLETPKIKSEKIDETISLEASSVSTEAIPEFFYDLEKFVFRRSGEIITKDDYFDLPDEPSLVAFLKDFVEGDLIIFDEANLKQYGYRFKNKRVYKIEYIQRKGKDITSTFPAPIKIGVCDNTDCKTGDKTLYRVKLFEEFNSETCYWCASCVKRDYKLVSRTPLIL